MRSSLSQRPILTKLNTSKTVENDVDEPLYTVRVVAERVGVPTATLRSWNQRYAVGPPEHSPGQHRLYSENDIAVVRRMHGLIVDGASPRSAARTAIDSVRPARGDTAALLVAAFDVDVFTAGLLLDRHLHHFGVLDTWDQLVRPAFASGSSPALVFVHGWRSSQQSYVGRAESLAEEGFIGLTFDLHGHGESETDGSVLDSTRTEDFLADVVAAYDFLVLQDDVDANRIGVVGASLGAYLGVWATTRRTAEASRAFVTSASTAAVAYPRFHCDSTTA